MNDKIQSILHTILYYVSVPKCVLCNERLDRDDQGLCKSCRKTYDEHKTENCSNCSEILSRCSCAHADLLNNQVKQHYKLFRYRNKELSAPGNHLIYSLKRENREDVVDFLSEELSTLLHQNFNIKGNYILTNIPRRKKSIIKYGFDHTAMLTEAISKKTGIPYVSFLKSLNKKDQKKTSGKERIKNVKFAFKNKHLDKVTGKSIIIVDDVVTTGASIANAASILKSCGAKEIIALTVASAYKDDQ